MAIAGMYTNSNAQSDFVRDGLLSRAVEGEPIFIASAFFTDYELLKELGSKSKQIRLIVRLGFPTSPVALQAALQDPYVDVRFFTSPSFHPKLYLFGDSSAVVGSANLTGAACKTNQEVMVSIAHDDPRFEGLAVLFGEYWEQAQVLTPEKLDDYRKLWNQHAVGAQAAKLEQSVLDTLGNSRFSNVETFGKKLSKENLFIESYRKTYQDAVRAFDMIRDEYKSSGYRKVEEAQLPLRLEVDSFFSFVRDRIATGESWRESTIGWTSGRPKVQTAMAEWRTTPHAHLETTIVQTNYPRLLKVFASEASIRSASLEQIYQALLTLHSFHDSLRFHPGGLVGLKESFMQSNDENRVKDSLAYLLHGQGDLVTRMANLIYSADYKLNVFGTANVQELVGWHNRDELPVVNGRTTKILRYFGFDVRQL